MEKILVDTDIVIDFLRGYQKRTRDIFIEIQAQKVKALISLMSIIELYSGKDVENKNKREILKKLLSYLEINMPDLSCAKLAGSLRRKYNLGLADAVIAATCQIEKAKLLTFNTRHFKGISEINLFY